MTSRVAAEPFLEASAPFNGKKTRGRSQVPSGRDPFKSALNRIEPLLIRFEEFVVGHDQVGERVLVALLARSHALVKGVPGTAKTFSALVMSRLLGMDFARIQLTPDLLPMDITGQEIFRPQIGEFEARKGPIFANLVLADEINRTSPKTQSALLEAMQEGQVTIGGQTLLLPSPFMVLATMNPLEQEGVYPLAEAQLDRFLFEIEVDNVDTAEKLMDIDDIPDLAEAQAMLDAEDVVHLQDLAGDVSASEVVRRYRTDLVLASRQHESVREGASDRRSKLLLGAAKARALIHGRSFVKAEDVRELVADTLRHVLVLTNEAGVHDVSVETVINEIINSVPMPEEK